MLPITQGSAAVVGLPATFTPPSSSHAIVPASGASDASRAMPAAGTKQSTAAGNAGTWSNPWIASTPILPTVCVPPFHVSNPSAARRPVAATSTPSRSRPTPEVSSHGVNVFV